MEFIRDWSTWPKIISFTEISKFPTFFCQKTDFLKSLILALVEGKRLEGIIIGENIYIIGDFLVFLFEGAIRWWQAWVQTTVA